MHLDKRTAAETAKRRAYQVSRLIFHFEDGRFFDQSVEELEEDRRRFVQQSWQNMRIHSNCRCCVNPRRRGERTRGEELAELATKEQLNEITL
jgi:hypothetical protein